MSVRSGLSSFVYRLPTTAPAQATATPIQYPIVISKGTYLISANISIVSGVNITGVLFSLQSANTVAPAAVADVILRNTVGSAATTLALPSGASTTQAFSLSGVYTIPADTTIYLNLAAVCAGNTWTVTTSASPSLVNSIQFVQIAY
jgi:hypothetical protein